MTLFSHSEISDYWPKHKKISVDQFNKPLYKSEIFALLHCDKIREYAFRNNVKVKYSMWFSLLAFSFTGDINHKFQLQRQQQNKKCIQGQSLFNVLLHLWSITSLSILKKKKKKTDLKETFTGLTVNAGGRRLQDGSSHGWCFSEHEWMSFMYQMWSESAVTQCRLRVFSFLLKIMFVLFYTSSWGLSWNDLATFFFFFKRLLPKSPSLLWKHKEIQMFSHIFLLPANFGL